MDKYGKVYVPVYLTGISAHPPPPPQETVLLLSFRECHRALMRCNNQPFQSEATDYYMCKHILHVSPYKVSQEPVSIHLPISRALAGEENHTVHLSAPMGLGKLLCVGVV